MSVSAAPSVSVQEAARRARVDERTVRRWISSGRLRASRGRHGYRIATAALAPWLEEAADIADGTRADLRAAAADMPEAPEAPPEPSALSVALATIAEQRVELEARRREVQELILLLERAQRPALPAPGVEISTPAADRPDLDVSRPWWARWRWWRR